MQKLIVTILIAASSVVARGSVNDSFFGTVDRIVSESPQLRAQAGRAVADSLTLLTDNNLPAPEISYEHLFGRNGDTKQNFGITQGFDWPGLYGARSRSARAAAAVADADYSSLYSSLRVEASSAVADIVATRHKIASLEGIITIYSSLLDTYQRHYADGNVSVLDVNKLRIEVASLTQNAEDEKIRLSELNARLADISGSADAPLLAAGLDELPQLSLASLADYREGMMANSPELAAMRARREMQERDYEVARMSSLPGFSLGYRYAYEEKQSFNGFELGLSIPLWNSRGRSRAAKAEVMAIDSETLSLTNSLNASLDHDYNLAVNLAARIDMLTKALEASDNIGLLRKAFEGGEITLTSFIQDMRFFVEAEQSLWDLRASLTRSLLALNRFIPPTNHQ